MTDHAFPWREEESIIGGHPVLRPTVDVKLEANDLTITAKALVDTGAPRCVFPRGIGDLISVEFPQISTRCDKRITLMGRTWPAQTALVTMHLQPFVDAWEAEVDFVHDEGLPFGLLGYEGFLNRWAVSFNGYHGYFVVAPVDLFHDRQPSDLLDRLRSRWPGI